MAAIASSLQAPKPHRKRSRVDLTLEDEEDNDGKIPQAIASILRIFPGIPREPMVAIFENIFNPKKDLIKLRTPEVQSSTSDNDSFEYKNTSSGIQLRQVTSRKVWGHDAALWLHCFTNYMAIWSCLFGLKHPRVFTDMTLFLRYIYDYSKIYRW